MNVGSTSMVTGVRENDLKKTGSSLSRKGRVTRKDIKKIGPDLGPDGLDPKPLKKKKEAYSQRDPRRS